MISIYLKRIIKQHFILGAFMFATAPLFIGAMAVFIHFSNAPGNNIIMYLDLYRDRSVLGSIHDLYQFILLGFVLVLANYFIVKELISKNAFLANVMASGTLMLSILILIAVNGIIHLN